MKAFFSLLWKEFLSKTSKLFQSEASLLQEHHTLNRRIQDTKTENGIIVVIFDMLFFFGHGRMNRQANLPIRCMFCRWFWILKIQIATAWGLCCALCCMLSNWLCVSLMLMMNVVAVRSVALKEEEIENIKSECIKLKSKKGKVKRSGLLVLFLAIFVWIAFLYTAGGHQFFFWTTIYANLSFLFTWVWVSYIFR